MEESLAAAWAGYNQEAYTALPGSHQWVDGDGDCKSDVLVRYRIYRLIEAVQHDDMERQSKPRGR